MRSKLSVLIIVILFGLASIGWADNPAPIGVNIELLEVDENDRVSVSLKFTLKNDSDEPVEVLKWGTPFEGEFTRDTFNIIHNGERVPYIGKLVKRLPPRKDDFIQIPAKSELAEIVYLEDGYKIYAPGFYTVQYSHATLGVNDARQMKSSPVQSGEVQFDVLFGTTEDAFIDPPLFKGRCSNSQFNAIKAAYRASQSMAANAKTVLYNTPVNQRPRARRYLEWFGTYNSARYARITSNFDKIHNALFTKTITAVCPGSRPNVYAYVYPSRPYKIYFCGAFFSAPLTGTDSKAGTIIHEVSHFNVVAGTDDVVYGQSGARRLARSNPNAAIRNADSHEYFAENSPKLPMPGGDNNDDGGSGGKGNVGRGEDDGGGGTSTEVKTGCFVQTLMN